MLFASNNQKCGISPRYLLLNPHFTMKIQRFLLLIAFLGVHIIGYAQTKFNLNLRVSERKVSVDAIEIDNQVIFLDRKGNIHAESNDDVNYDYYDRFDGDDAGKLKSVNNLVIKNYDQFDRDELRGKVKLIGTVKFTYYDLFDDDMLRGKLKAINDIQIKYNDRFGPDELIGKLKSVGNTTISYYDKFDGPGRSGKLKSVRGKTPGVKIITSTGLAIDAEISDN